MKRTLTLLMALTMLFGLTAFTAQAEGETLTMLQRLPAVYVLEDNPVIKAWGDMLGITVEIEAPPISSYNDRRNVILASGDLPDIIYVGDMGALYTQWSRDGLFLDLAPYLNETDMPNAFKVLTQEELFGVKVQLEDGTSGIFSMPRVQTKPWDCFLYRGDWLEKLGLQVPRTPQEFADVMLAFATQDPDGNGVDDTYGWSYNTVMGPDHRLMLAPFGVRPNEVPDAEGNYQILQAQPGYMEYLDWMRGMYEAGSLDPEFYLTKMYEDDDLFYAGKIGTKYSNTVIEHLITHENNEAFRGANPDGYLVAGPALTMDGTSVADIYYSPQIWGNYAINAESDKIDLAIKFLDAGYTDAVNELLMFGLEGVTYTTFDRERRFATKNEEQKINWEKYCASYATMNYQLADKGLLIANGNNEEEVAKFTKAYDDIGALTNRVPYLTGNSVPGHGDVMIPIVESGIEDEWKEIRTKYITGEVDKDTLTAFIAERIVPAYQPLIDLYASYNDGAGFNK